MTAPILTYVLQNDTLMASAQVNQDFTDVLNGITDGSGDISVAALSAAGDVSFRSHTSLGNGSADDLTINASLASTIDLLETSLYSIGSATLGLAGIYFGTSSTQTARIVSASLAASRTYTLPDAGADANLALSEGAATINGVKTFSGQMIAKGTATDDNPAAGYIGEIKVASVSGDSVPGSSEFNATSLVLTAGDWEVDAKLSVLRNSATYNPAFLPAVVLAIIAGSGTYTIGHNYVENDADSASFNTVSASLGPIRVKCDGTNITIGNQAETANTTTLVVAVQTTSISSGTPLFYCFIRARRVR